MLDKTEASIYVFAELFSLQNSFAKETGLSYNWHRDYDASLGRYIQSDPIGLAGGLNRFGYAGQNPITNIDPYGLFQFGIRPLDGTSVTFGNPSSTNIGIFHEHGFYQDGSKDNVGFFPAGPGPDTNFPANETEYKLIGRVYDDHLMRQAQKLVDSGEYDLLSNNCQDYADKLRTAYRKISIQETERIFGGKTPITIRSIAPITINNNLSAVE